MAARHGELNPAGETALHYPPLNGHVDLALVVDVLPDKDNAAKDLGVFNIASALPFSIAPAIAPVILAVGGGSYDVLYTVAGLCAIIGAFAVLPVKRAR